MKAKAARKVSFVELCIEERRVALNACRPPSSTRIAGRRRLAPGANRGRIEYPHSMRSEFLEKQVFQVYPPVRTGGE